MTDTPRATGVIVYEVRPDSETGEMLGTASLAMADQPLAIFHTETAERVAADTTQRTVRLQILTSNGPLPAAEAIVLTAIGGNPPAAFMYLGSPDVEPQWALSHTSWRRQLRLDERRGLAGPLPHPPDRPSTMPANRGWWCRVWPHCPGC